MRSANTFPFVAVVGQDRLKLALVLNLVDPRIGGVLIRGEKGTAKTTLVRSMVDLLEGDAPLVELPIGASEDRVKGSIDLTVVLQQGTERLKPGLLSQADKGILYIDEVNLLADHLVDLVLDSAATGVNVVERDGFSIAQSARFCLIGTMNPEEGEIRPQLLDRFGLCVDVETISSPTQRVKALTRRLEFDSDPLGFSTRYLEETLKLRGVILSARERCSKVDIMELISLELIQYCAQLCAQRGSEGMRADLALIRAAVALALLQGSQVPLTLHVDEVAPLVFAHRSVQVSKESPSSQPEGEDLTFEEYLNGPGSNEPDPERKSRTGFDSHPASPTSQGTSRPADAEESSSHEKSYSPSLTPQEPVGESEKAIEEPLGGGSSSAEPVTKLKLPRTKSSTTAKGRVEGSLASTFHQGEEASLAVRESLLQGLARSANLGFQLSSEDLRWRQVKKRLARCVVFLLDTSKSMTSSFRISVMHETASHLLSDAYTHRSQVALITFGDGNAVLQIRPTRSPEVVKSRVQTIAAMGNTPLALGITRALEFCEDLRKADVEPLLVVMTDGKPTHSPDLSDPLTAALTAATSVREAGVESLVCDFDQDRFGPGLTKLLAEAMCASYVQVEPRVGPR